MSLRLPLFATWLALVIGSAFLAAPLRDDFSTPLISHVIPIVACWLAALGIGIWLAVMAWRRPRPHSFADRAIGYLPAIMSVAFWLVMLAGFAYFSLNFQLGPGDDMPADPAPIAPTVV